MYKGKIVLIFSAAASLFTQSWCWDALVPVSGTANTERFGSLKLALHYTPPELEKGEDCSFREFRPIHFMLCFLISNTGQSEPRFNWFPSRKFSTQDRHSGIHFPSISQHRVVGARFQNPLQESQFYKPNFLIFFLVCFWFFFFPFRSIIFWFFF